MKKSMVLLMLGAAAVSLAACKKEPAGEVVDATSEVSEATAEASAAASDAATAASDAAKADAKAAPDKAGKDSH